MNDAEQVAIALHPELGRLATLRDSGGWRFVHEESEPGVVVLTRGVRVWPDESADALGVRGQTDAQALRTNPDGCGSLEVSVAVGFWVFSVVVSDLVLVDV